LGWAYFRLGNVADAEKNLKDAARLDVGSATIQEHLGDVYREQGKIDLAAAAWQRALKLASENVEIERLKKKLGQAK
jgi:Tfp pilus assembly protein PilF